jgi:vitamin B12 transporter
MRSIHTSKRFIVGVVLAGVTAASGAFAQSSEAGDAEPGSSRAEDRDEDRAGDDEDVERIVVMGVRGGELAEGPSAFATRIDPEDFEGEQKSLEDLLAESPGVQIRRFGGAGERSEISIRGFASSQVVVALDGVPLNSAFGGGVDLSAIPVELLESVEVQRGGGAVSMGSGAMGGVVQLRTKRPGEVASSQVKGRVGSFDTYNASAFHGAPGEVADYGIGYSFFRTEGDFEYQRPIRVLPDGTRIVPDPRSGDRINNEHERHTLVANVGRELPKGSYLQLSQILGYRSQGEPGPDGGAIGTSGGQQEHAHLRELSSISQLRWEAIDLGLVGVTSSAHASYRHQHRRFKDEDPALSFAPIDSEDDDSTASLGFASTWRGAAFGLDHAFDVSLGGQREALDADDISLEERYGAHLSLRDEAGLFDSKLLFVPGVRADWNDDSDFRLLPSIGVVVSPVSWLRFKGNAERAFRNPSFGALYLPDRGFVSGNRDLDPEKSDNFDVGVEFSFAEVGPLRDVKFAASAFYSTIENTIIWVFVSPTRIRPINSGDATTKGYELSGSLTLWRWLSLSSNHTYVNAEYDSGPRLPGRAESESRVRLQIAEPGLFKLVGEYQHTGSISVSTGGSYIIPSRDVWNLSSGVNFARVAHAVGWDVPVDEIWLSGAIENLADESIQDSLFFPQPGRSYGLGLEVKW